MALSICRQACQRLTCKQQAAPHLLRAWLSSCRLMRPTAVTLQTVILEPWQHSDGAVHLSSSMPEAHVQATGGTSFVACLVVELSTHAANSGHTSNCDSRVLAALRWRCPSVVKHARGSRASNRRHLICCVLGCRVVDSCGQQRSHFKL